MPQAQIQLDSGFITREVLLNRGFFGILHGGAGPQDPNSQSLNEANHQLEFTLAEVKKRNGIDDLLTILPEGFHPSWLPHHPSRAAALSLLAACILENAECFNAGFGSALQEDGIPRVSASVMESTSQRFSAVINGEEIKNPSQLAYFLQGRKHSILDHQGTNLLARELAVPRCNLLARRRAERWLNYRFPPDGSVGGSGSYGTVGAIVADRDGNLSAITSTGGVGNESKGRVGDSPTPAGNFCDKRTAVSCTGVGEDIVAEAVASTIAVRCRDGMSLRKACQLALTEAWSKKRFFGFIAASFADDGSLHWAAGHSTPSMIWGLSEKL